MKFRGPLVLGVICVSTLGISACVANNAGNGKDTPIAVSIKDDSCDVATATASAGTVRFTLKNEGTVRNEFEILASDKLRIVGERENLGPGTSTDYTIVLEPGTYYTACKKNMVGALVGVKEFKVSDSGAKVELAADEKKAAEDAVTNYTAYVRDQTGQLLAETKKFADLYQNGKTEEAKHLYPRARQYYERIEPTAEAFGDIDPAIDERETDWQEADDKGKRPWTGWHVAEKDLWRPAGYNGLDDAKRKEIATKLVADTQRLYDLVYSKNFKINLDEISNGAIALLEEVAISKITGEEEAFSHTDLFDFQANLEGAKVAFGNVEALAKKRNPDLVKEIHTRIGDLEANLNSHKEGDGYVSYDKVDEKARKALSDKVNALRKPLAKLTEATIK